MRQPSNKEFKYPVLFDPKFPNLVKEVPISTLKNKIKARIFNLSGRLKRVIEPEVFNNVNGNQVIVWDGKDSDGKVVKSGLYIVTLEKEKTVLKTTVGVLNR